MSYQELSKILNKEAGQFFQDFFAGLKTGSKKTNPGNNNKHNKAKKMDSFLKVNKSYLISLALAFFVFGFVGGIFALTYFTDSLAHYLPQLKERLLSFSEKENGQQPLLRTAPVEKLRSSDYQPQTSQEEKTIEVVKEASPGVVSIVITKEVPVFEKYYEKPFESIPSPGPQFPFEIEFEVPRYREKGAEKKKIGSGTGFIVSADGLVVTNKHVVADEEAQYTVILSDGKKYPADILDKDPLQDLAFLKIVSQSQVGESGELAGRKFPVLKLGDSDNLQIGQTVVAIGNALGEFRNTVSVGVISGLGRRIIAEGGGVSETLEDIIQTDAAINQGNSGGPLLNLKGEVVGVNVAKAEAAQSIGFSIPVNEAKLALFSIQKNGRIARPFLGIVYTSINPEVQEEKGFTVDYGALIVDDGNVSVVPDSAAERAGLKPGDIILEVNGEKVTQNNSLAKIIKRYLPEDEIGLKILRGKKELMLKARLGEISSDDEFSQ